MSDDIEIEFKAGDEIEWYVGGDRCRGRVFENDDDCPDGMAGEHLYVRSYDAMGNLTPDDENATQMAIPTDAKIASAVDQLAETVPEIYHPCPLINCTKGARRDPDEVYCGLFKVEVKGTGVFEKGKSTREVDETINHRVMPESHIDDWRKVVRATAADLDHSNRERPLDERKLPEEAYAEADKLKLCRDCFRVWVLQSCYGEEPMRHTEEELKQFIFDVVDNKVFTDRHLPENAGNVAGMVFMCLMMMPPPPPDFLDKVALIYEHMSKAGPRSINGMPMFTSHRLMHKEDWARVQPHIEAELKRREDLKL